MAEIALRTYYRQIDQLIDQKHLEEALAHCKNILLHYPKDVEAYRLMGKALLERGRHGDAADVFQRVLSARPDDFISHVGMAIVREDEGNLEAALWHMERAFESSPSNPAVQDELRRLYGRRDGIVPHRAQLTRGALARLYYKQGLFAQAEAELRAGLGEQADRSDLLTLLVQTLWENNRREEAGTLCQDLLERLPYNLEANRVMAHITKGQNQLETARLCRQRLEALDPYEAYAGEGTLADSVNPDAVRITEIDYAPEVTDDRPEWSTTLGADLAPGPEEALPDWVRSGTALLIDESQSDSDRPTGGASPDLPEWMRATTGILGHPPAAQDALAVEPEAPIEPPAMSGLDTPDWLTSVTGGDSAVEAPGDADWLSGLSDPTDAPSASAHDAEVLPDWLQRMSAEDGPINTGWLPADAGLAAEAPAPTEEPLAPLTAAALGAAGAGAIVDQPQEAPSSAGELPDWLKASTGAPTDVPDWLRDSTGADETDWQPESGPGATAEESLLAAEVPEWLRGATGQTGMLRGASPSSDDEPDADSALPAPESESLEAAADLPEWLKDSRPTAEAAPDLIIPDWLSTASSETGPIGELPDWLKAEQAEVTDVTLPAATVEEPPAPDATVDVRAIDPTPPASQLDAELPEWLATVEDAAPESLNAPDRPAGSDDDAFAWLESLAARQGVDPAELSTPVSGEAEALPDWLKGAVSDSEPPAPAETEDRAEALDLPDFLQPASPDAIARANTPVDWEADEPTSASEDAADVSETAASMPEWVKALAPSEDVTDVRPLEQLPDVDPAELPEWLRPATAPESTPDPVVTPDPAELNAEDAFAWLEGLAAAQGADPETLSAPSTPTAVEGDAALPDWLRGTLDSSPADAPSDGPEIPEWVDAAAAGLTAASTEPAVGPVAELPADAPAAAAEPTAEAPIGDDDAFAWLESLAARQGADPETLSAAPEPAVGPAAEPTAEAPIGDDDAFAWLESLAARQGADPETLSAAPEPAVGPVVELPVDAPAAEPTAEAPIGDDDAFAWLESLAARQGADPETLSAAPEPAVGPVAELPADAPAAAPEPTAEAPIGDDDAFAWLESLAARQGADPETLSAAPEPAVGPVAESPADAPAAEPTAEAPIGDDDAFAWLESLAARQGADPETLSTAPEPAVGPVAELPVDAPAAEPTAEAPIGDDDAFAWLESLAARQGADPETLSAAPEPAVGPVAELPADAPAAAPEPTAEAPIGDDDAFAWLESLAARQGADPETLTAAPEPAAAPEPTAEAPIGDDDAFAWLESLAARQGADPETLSAAPEPTASGADAIDLPDWPSDANPEPVAQADPDRDRRVTRPLAPPTDDETEAVSLTGVAWLREPLNIESVEAETPEVTLPDWLQDEIGVTPPTAELEVDPAAGPAAPQPMATRESTAQETPAETPAGPPITTADSRTALLAGKLSERKRAREAEIQDRFERQRAMREAAQREIELKLAARRAGQSTEPPIAPSDLPTAPLPAMDPAPVAESLAGTGPLDRGRRRWRQQSTPLSPDVTYADVFARCRSQLAQGQEREALTGLTQLIKRDHAVAEILAEVQAYIARKPASALAYRTLGDAQMKLGRLQEALASYRAALERV